MKNNWRVLNVGKLAQSISNTHNFGRPALIFLNTSDVLRGKILHKHYSSTKNWPGQAKKSIQKNDILFSEIRPENGRYAYVDMDANDYVVSTKLMVIRANQEVVLPRFLYHSLTSKSVINKLQHLAEARSGTFPQITFDQVSDLELVVPPFSEQAAITCFLDNMESRINTLERMNAILEGIVRAIFKSWFVDFDPVRAKVDGRDLRLPKPIADLFPHSFEDSELREIPKNWEAKDLARLASLNAAVWTKQTRPISIKYIDLSNTKWGKIEKVVNYTSNEAPSRAQRVLYPNDTIIGTVRPGNGSYAYINDSNLTASTAFAVLTPLKSEYGEFVYLASSAQANIERLARLADGGAYPAVTSEMVVQTEVVKPSDSLIEAFSRICRPLFDQISNNDRLARTHTILRDTLLPKIISGEIRLNLTRRMVETAA